MAEKKENIHKGHRQKVRNQFYEAGIGHMPDHVVLEFILYFGIPYKDTNEIAHNLINTFGSFDAVFRADLNDLKGVKGMTENAACLIKLLLPVYNRYTQCLADKQPVLLTAREIADFMRPRYEGTYNEKVFLLCFDSDHCLISTKLIATGDVSSAVFSFRDIASIVLETKTRNVVLVHNHPYAIAVPSKDDVLVTEKLRKFLSFLKVSLDDHIIIADPGFCSLANTPKFATVFYDKASNANYFEEDDDD